MKESWDLRKIVGTEDCWGKGLGGRVEMKGCDEEFGGRVGRKDVG